MKDKFPAYYSPTSQDFDDLWEKCTFILDTNVLLGLYRYSPETLQELVDTLKILSASNRLWIPHQAALEYHKNRLSVINKENSKYKQISGIVTHHIKALKEDLKKADRIRKNTHAASIVAALDKVIDKSSEEIQQELKKHIDKQPDRTVNDEIRDTLSDLFKGKIGAPYNQTRLDNIYEECNRRYDLGIPPGYDDVAKKGRAKYGDAILWFQIIDYAKEKHLPVILVTDEEKTDWWNPGVKDEPNYDLVQEFMSKTEHLFYLYSTYRFLHWAKKRINPTISDTAIAEIERSKVQDGDRTTSIYTISFDAIDQGDIDKSAIIVKDFEKIFNGFHGEMSEEFASIMLKTLAKRHKFTHDIQIELKKPIFGLEDD